MNLERHFKRSILNQIQIYCLFSCLIGNIQLNALQFKFFSYTSTVISLQAASFKGAFKSTVEKKKQ